MNLYCPRPEAGCQYFRQAQQRNTLYGKRPPPQIRINRGLEIIFHRNKGSFYRPNPSTVFISITPSTDTSTKLTTSQNLQHLKKPIQLIYGHVTRNPANCVLNQIILLYSDLPRSEERRVGQSKPLL